MNLTFRRRRRIWNGRRPILPKKKLDHERSASLFEKGWVSRAALDQSEAAFQSARSAVDYAQSRVDLAQRNLDNTVLRAPFDGVVAERRVEPFEDVAAGQAIVELNTTDVLEIAFLVPESEIQMMSLGRPVTVTAGTGSHAIRGRITELGSVAGSGNAYPARATLGTGADGLRPGMTGTVQVTVNEGGTSGYLIPLSAIVLGPEPRTGYVFRYDRDEGAVRQAVVRSGPGGVRENMVIVSDGLKAGDILAVAGVSFLRDGQ